MNRQGIKQKNPAMDRGSSEKNESLKSAKQIQPAAIRALARADFFRRFSLGFSK
jgi:hypothetical protein